MVFIKTFVGLSQDFVNRATPSRLLSYLYLLPEVDRARKNFVVQKVSEEKSEEWKQDLWSMVDFCAEMGVTPIVTLPTFTPLAERREPPPKASISGQLG